MLPITFALLAFATPAAPDALLAAVPDDAFAVATCLDPATLEERIQQNAWADVLGGPEGESFLSDIDGALNRKMGNEVGDLITLGQELDGQCVLFVTARGGGFVAEPPPSRERLLTALKGWLPAEAGTVARAPATIAGAHVQLFVRADDEGTPWHNSTRVTALVDHPQALGLFAGESEEHVLGLLRASLAGLGTDRRAAAVEGLMEARNVVGPLDLELFVDCTPFAHDAEQALGRVSRQFFIDPTDLLGLEKGTWFYTTAGVFAGRKLEWRARLAIPPESLAAQLADSFKPLPTDLLASIPKGVWNVHALRWDVVGFYDRVRAVLEEADQAGGAAVLDQSLAMAEEASGVDLEQQLFRQLEGTFALYFGADPEALDRSSVDAWRSLGLQLRVNDGVAFREAFEALTGMAGADEGVVSKEIAGTEALVWEQDDDLSGAGVAFLPRSFLIALNGGLLEESLEALARKASASLLDGTDFEAAFDESRGACGFFAIELAPLRALAGVDGHEEGDAPDPFQGSIVGSVNRTAQGFDLRVSTR